MTGKNVGDNMFAPKVLEYKVLKALVGRKRFASRERDDDIKHMQGRVTQRLRERHFHDYDFILYFDKSMGEILQILSTIAQRNVPPGASQSMAQLVYLKGIPSKSMLLMQDTIERVHQSLRTWLKKEIGWQQLPPEVRMDSGPWRTQE